MHTLLMMAARSVWFLSQFVLVGIPFILMVIAALIGCVITLKDIETVGPFIEKRTPFGWLVIRMATFTNRYFYYPM